MRKFAAICLLLVAALPAGAVEGSDVLYSGGTVPGMKQGLIGKLDTTSKTTLEFEYSGNKLEIPYVKIDSFEYREDVARHLGVLPAIAVGLVKKRQRKHFFQINFRDENNLNQVVIFEVSKQMPQTLMAVLRSRAPERCIPSGAPVCNPKEPSKAIGHPRTPSQAEPDRVIIRGSER